MAIKELKSLTFGDGDTYVLSPTKWEEIPDNPFGGKGDIVSWAGAGIDVSTVPFDTWVKVSDAVVPRDELFIDGNFIDGADISYFSDNVIISSVEQGWSFPSSGVSDNWFADCFDNYNGNDYSLVNFRPDGVYFQKIWGASTEMYPLSVTFPNCGKFTSVKPIETKYLPDSLQLETVTMSDTLTIDTIINDEDWTLDQAKLAAADGWYRGWRKVSDADIPVESGYLNNFGDVRNYDFGYIENTEYYGYCSINANLYSGEDIYKLLITDENGNTTDFGYYIPDGADRGMYIDPYFESVTFTSTLGAVFEVKTPKPIDKKYLPNDIGGGMPEVTAEDNGKFLRVVDGAWAAVAIPNAEGVGF